MPDQRPKTRTTMEIAAFRAPATSTGTWGNIPMGTAATPTDIGHCIAWMCSDYARLITGSDFVIDGGARAKYWGYTPPADNAGPAPLVRLDVTELDGPVTDHG